jgi:lysophospholipid acyltransferase (LPLAT)-like uncharacterized protein
MKFKKRLLFWLATRLGWAVVILLGHLTRLRYHGREHLEKLRGGNRPFLYCLWHGKLLLPIFAHRHMNICAMVSIHSDGEMIAQTLHRLGYVTARGSSTRSGSRALIEMIRLLKQAGTGAVTPDGPTGPRHVLKPGVIQLAQRANAQILPLSFASSRAWIIKSWDRFTIPKPFSKSVICYGEPISVPRKLTAAEFETVRQEVEKKMLALEATADAYFNEKESNEMENIRGVS